MAVVACDEIRDGRGGEVSFDRSRRWTRVFRVVTDNDLDGGPTVVQAAGLPGIGAFYLTPSGEVDTDAVCQSLSPAPDPSANDPRVWIVTATYDTKVDTGHQSGGGSGEPGQGGASPTTRTLLPLDRPVKWAAGTVKAKKAVLTDKDAVDVKNSAGQLYSPGYERDIVLGRITAIKNYASFAYKDKLDLIEKINSAAWKGFPAKTVKIDDIGITEEFEHNIPYLAVTWSFLYNPDGWNPTRILDRGTYYKVGGVITTDIDANGAVVGEYLLDGSGGKLTGAAVAVYNLFRFHDETSFASIP